MKKHKDMIKYIVKTLCHLQLLVKKIAPLLCSIKICPSLSGKNASITWKICIRIPAAISQLKYFLPHCLKRRSPIQAMTPKIDVIKNNIFRNKG
jgi:hypothetical protein